MNLGRRFIRCSPHSCPRLPGGLHSVIIGLAFSTLFNASFRRMASDDNCTELKAGETGTQRHPSGAVRR
jgi:hypothetical protein